VAVLHIYLGLHKEKTEEEVDMLAANRTKKF